MIDDIPSVIPEIGSYWRETHPSIGEDDYIYRVEHYTYDDHTVYVVALNNGQEYIDHGHLFDTLYTPVDEEEIPLILLAHTGG